MCPTIAHMWCLTTNHQHKTPLAPSQAWGCCVLYNYLPLLLGPPVTWHGPRQPTLARLASPTTTSGQYGLIRVKEEGRTGFSEGLEGCSKGFPKGKAQGKSRGAAMPARGKVRPPRLFYSDVHHIWNRFFQLCLNLTFNHIKIRCITTLASVWRKIMASLATGSSRTPPNLSLFQRFTQPAIKAWVDPWKLAMGPWAMPWASWQVLTDPPTLCWQVYPQTSSNIDGLS